MPRYRSEADLPLSVTRGQGTIPGQIVDQIRSLVAEGRLRPGDPLPSSRALAARIGVSRGSVTSAYDQLAVEGYLEADRGSTRITTELSGLGAGGFTGNNPAAINVAPATPARGPHATSSSAAGHARTQVRNCAPIVGGAKESRALALLDLRPGTPDTSSLANTTWRAAWRAAAADPSLGYEPQGSPDLRNQLS
ncbi:MAG: winged helix-turn-helix domain-containing protein, partial [Kocuria sp.]|nr:winged helix-turn-helix domain-containing protein [Kocuria sp.]